jgi:tetratricopeptide (TPR) repeat protein
MERARSAALKAIQLDGELASAHASLGLVKAAYDWDWPAARDEFQRAHQLDPADARVHEAWVSGYLVPTGEMDEALKQIREARDFNPTSARIASTLGNVHFFRREYDQAIIQQRQALELDPTFFPAYLGLAEAYTQRGMPADASDAREKWLAAYGGSVPELLGAYACTLSGRSDDVLNWLEEASRRRLPVAIYMNVNPRFETLRSELRFSKLVAKTGLNSVLPIRPQELTTAANN